MAFNAISAYIAGSAKAAKNPVQQLYRTISKEVPRVLTIYDADISPDEARRNIRELFRKNGHIKDPAVIDMLVKKGYMEVEETLMQWKQKTHLMRLLAPEYEEPRKARAAKQGFKERFLAGVVDD